MFEMHQFGHERIQVVIRVSLQHLFQRTKKRKN